MRGLFVTGTDTNVGKSVLSAALIAAMVAAGERVVAHKPVVTGLGQTGKGSWPPDHELLAAMSGQRPHDVAPRRYEPAVSPQLAAQLNGEAIDRRDLLAAVPPAGRCLLVVEGVGGLLAPFAEDFSVRDLASRLGLPVVVAARPGLGTINHTLLTLEAARAAELDVRAVVLTPWPKRAPELHRSNRSAIARAGAIPVEVLARVRAPERELLAAAGEQLPWRAWVGSDTSARTDGAPNAR
ncbi:MAG TPA: dethiobiotin synthase [Solirubrobacteraceae bacterium]|jgi:dethiobiotin synthetase|nr:dethiobiotin synthase [Solirubrobacteraceae bacterium]